MGGVVHLVVFRLSGMWGEDCVCTRYILTHVVAQDLRGGLALTLASLDKFIARIPLDADAQADILFFHGKSVSNGYTSDQTKIWGRADITRAHGSV